jgi:hypothetical protein
MVRAALQESVTIPVHGTTIRDCRGAGDSDQEPGRGTDALKDQSAYKKLSRVDPERAAPTAATIVWP